MQNDWKVETDFDSLQKQRRHLFSEEWKNERTNEFVFNQIAYLSYLINYH